MAKKALSEAGIAIKNEAAKAKIEAEKGRIIEGKEPVIVGAKTKVQVRSEMLDGEFRGDFTRDSFDPMKHYSRVLIQQGRVQLDADHNEQSSILLHYLQTLAADLIGPFGGPMGDECGFSIIQIEDELNDFKIGKGRYYIKGVLCENEAELNYLRQLSPATQMPPLAKDKAHFVYLDTWERTISSLEDAGIREVALNGPDTAVRSKTEWIVRISRTLLSNITKEEMTCSGIGKRMVAELAKVPPFLGRLVPEMNAEHQVEDICNIRPDSKYRGVENQLYRVEVHTGGTAAGGATFKWSRENGCVDFPILAMDGEQVTLGNLGKDESLGLRPGDLVEIIDDDYVRMRYDLDDLWELTLDKKDKIDNHRPLCEVADVDRAHLTVTLADPRKLTYDRSSTSHPVLRRWDQDKARSTAPDHCMPISESDDFIDIEDGIRIRFYPSLNKKRSIYLPGDYWLLPARVVTGAIDWPKAGDAYVPLPPQGIIHRYAPLGIVTISKKEMQVQNCQRHFRITFKEELTQV